MRAAKADRRGTAADWLVLGLGNPGPQYERTRHNVGADTVALLAHRRGSSLGRSKERALVAEVRLGEARVVLAFPVTYYNEAGLAALALVRRHGIEDGRRVVVVHDELDLPPGVVRLKEGGGLAGNKGLQSIKAHLGTDEFVRVRIGIGKPPGRQEGADHVLRKPAKREREELDVAIEEAADAVELLVAEGAAKAMNKVNAPRPTP